MFVFTFFSGRGPGILSKSEFTGPWKSKSHVGGGGHAFLAALWPTNAPNTTFPDTHNTGDPSEILSTQVSSLLHSLPFSSSTRPASPSLRHFS